MAGLLYLLFFLSGFSGLIYQVVWVRVFGNVFGNTVYSASLVVAVFMLGLGAGSYIVGTWADRRYAIWPGSLLRTYGYVELAIGLMGLAVAISLPHLGQVSALVSSYTREPNGWYALSTTSYLARGAVASLLLTPITLLMGGTLTLLIRHLVRSDLSVGAWRIAVLYAANTCGAALGCFLTDFTLVPASGLLGTQIIAVSFNVVAGLGALYLGRLKPDATFGGSAMRNPPHGHVPHPNAAATPTRRRVGDPGAAALGTPRRPGAAPFDKLRASRARRGTKRTRQDVRLEADLGQPQPDSGGGTLAFTSLALALSGFAAMGMEILWFRHFTILLGGFRAVFSLLLTVILIGIGAGSLVGGALHRRLARPVDLFMIVQGLFVGLVLLGLGLADAAPLDAAVVVDVRQSGAVGFAGPAQNAQTDFARAVAELWFNARPILLEVALPALLMGFSFPLANAIIQRAEPSVGRRAGVLYLSNTAGAVCGSLAAGFLLLPALGIQGSATVLTMTAAVAVVPLYVATRRSPGRPKPAPTTVIGAPATVVGAAFRRPGATLALAASLMMGSVALGWWLRLPPDHVNTRALPRPTDNERVLAVSEGLTEIIAVTEVPALGRTLLTNGHPMSSTRPLSQRYMRSLAHIPLLAIEKPETVLVIGFGVGNTTHAATLHPSIRRIEVADLSRGILAHAKYFEDVNGGVLNNARVVVYVNDGRQHLQMQPEGSYDLVTLEPPPIGYAGVGSLYSQEFYELVRTRLKPNGYVSQWLPAYQVPGATTLAMVRAFVDVFPQAVLVSGAEADLLLIGANDARIEIDPGRVMDALSSAPEVQADLRRLDLGSVREIVGAFVASATTLVDATRDVAAASDDRPMQEYGVRSLLNFGEAVPGAIVDLSRVAEWCPRCFVDGAPAPLAAGLDTYLKLLNLAYTASPADVTRVRSLGERGQRRIAGSAYLGAIVPESADAYNLLGIALASRGDIEQAITEFRYALALEPESAETHWHLGAALASRGQQEEAVEHLRRSVQLDPRNGRAHNDLGVLLGTQGRLDEAIEHFEQALAIDPASTEARRNLTIARRPRGLDGERR